MTRPLLLLVATGMRLYREYLLASIASEFRVHLFHTTEPTWERRYLSGWTVVPDTADGPAMAEEARLIDKIDTVAGVLCWDEARIQATAHVAEALGLRNGDPAVILGLRDKGRTRRALAAAGVAQPASVPVATLDQALAAAQLVGYPVILKPRALGASLGVVRVDDADELRERFAFTLAARAPAPVDCTFDHPVLVEHCVMGQEISVDSVVRAGRVTPVFVARKVLGYPPYAEEVGHFVDAADPLLTDTALLAALQDTHAALGFQDGWTHSEFMLTSTGPQVIEVNGRLGGDMIPYLGALASGIDPGVAAARVACGLDPDLTPTRCRVAGIRFFYVRDEDSMIESVAFAADDLPGDVDRAVAVAVAGAVVSPPPRGTVWGRVAFATAAAGSGADCARALDAAEDALEIRVSGPHDNQHSADRGDTRTA
jgi:ATP-grasp domain